MKNMNTNTPYRTPSYRDEYYEKQIISEKRTSLIVYEVAMMIWIFINALVMIWFGSLH